MSSKITLLGFLCVVALVVTVLACSRLHQLGNELASNETDSTTDLDTEIDTLVSDCQVAYFESFDTNPLKNTPPCKVGDRSKYWYCTRYNPHAGLLDWRWSDESNPVPPGGQGGHMTIDSRMLNPDDTQSGVVRDLYTPFIDVGDCNSVTLGLGYHMQGSSLGPSLHVSSLEMGDVNFKTISMPGRFDLDGSASVSIPAPYLPSHNYLGFLFRFNGNQSTETTPFGLALDNITVTGNGCSVDLDFNEKFDTNNLIYPCENRSDILDWDDVDCLDWQPGPSWEWSEEDNTIPGASGGHMTISTGELPGPIPFNDYLSLKEQDVSKCESAVLSFRVDYVKNPALPDDAPNAWVKWESSIDPNWGSKYKFSRSEKGLRTVTLEDISEVGNLRILVGHVGNVPPPKDSDHYLKIDDVSIIGFSK